MICYLGVDKDCTGHGQCNAAIHECSCYPGWTGEACQIPDCPGSPDCSGHGVCDSSLDTPRCVDCVAGWMGKACDELCTHGTQSAPNSGVCECDSCYTGKDCDHECSDHGSCTGGLCVCDTAFRGTKCEVAGCPGLHQDCSLHGSCNSATQTCICLPGESS